MTHIRNKIAILIGSSNNDGNTMALVNKIAQATNVTIYNLNNYQISPFDYEHQNINDDFIGLVKELIQYDQIIFASPVYWYTMSAQMKVFFDRLSDLLHVKKELGRQLRGKATAIISTGASPQPERSFEEVFTNSFDYLAMNYKGMLYCFCEQSFKLEEHKDYIDKHIQIIT